MELSGHRPWAGQVLTLPHPACPHPGSGWMSGRLREKRGVLKVNIQKTKIIASGPITSSQIDGETVETVADFIFIFWTLFF